MDREQGSILREMVLVATYRTGSNYLCECLREFPEAVAVNEVFNPRGVFGLVSRPAVLRHFGRLLGRRGVRQTDPDLSRFFRSDPARALDELASAAEADGATLLSYKVFEDQLPLATFTALLAARRPAVVFLVRRRLDSYISFVKAGHLDKWRKVDTTHLRPALSVDDFLERAEQSDRWYAAVRSHARKLGLRTLTLSYDRHVDAPKPLVVDRLQLALGGIGLSMSAPLTLQGPNNERQDQAVDPFARIENGEEVRQLLAARGRLAYALDTPLRQHVWRGRQSWRDWLVAFFSRSTQSTLTNR